MHLCASGTVPASDRAGGGKPDGRAHDFSRLQCKNGPVKFYFALDQVMYTIFPLEWRLTVEVIRKMQVAAAKGKSPQEIAEEMGVGETWVRMVMGTDAWHVVQQAPDAEVDHAPD